MSTTQQLAQARAWARERWQEKQNAPLTIAVGAGTCGLAAGAKATMTAIEAELERRGLAAVISQVGCVGMCSYEPMVELEEKGRPRLSYGQASGQNVPEIFVAAAPSHYAVAR